MHFLHSPSTRGSFYHLYMMMDVWSRKIVGFAVHEVESPDHASVLLREALANEKIDGRGLVLHADNGGPMKGATMKATMEKLEVHASYSRPPAPGKPPRRSARGARDRVELRHRAAAGRAILWHSKRSCLSGDEGETIDYFRGVTYRELDEAAAQRAETDPERALAALAEEGRREKQRREAAAEDARSRNGARAGAPG